MDPLTQMAFGAARKLARDSRANADALDYANSEIEAANADIRKANQIIADLRKRVADLEFALLIEKAHADGLKAYRDDLRAAHPNSPRLAPSGQKFRNSGNPKPLAALAYDAAFDRVLRDARISAPEQYRD